MTKYTGIHATDDLFTRSRESFAPMALELFRFQYANNPLYREYTDTLGVDPATIAAPEAIPFLPIGFF